MVRSGRSRQLPRAGRALLLSQVRMPCSRAWTKLMHPTRWKTRVELANAIFEYIEIFHNRKRRHSSLGMHPPIEFEKIHTYPSAVA